MSEFICVIRTGIECWDFMWMILFPSNKLSLPHYRSKINISQLITWFTCWLFCQPQLVADFCLGLSVKAEISLLGFICNFFLLLCKLLVCHPQLGAGNAGLLSLACYRGSVSAFGTHVIFYLLGLEPLVCLLNISGDFMYISHLNQ